MRPPKGMCEPVRKKLQKKKGLHVFFTFLRYLSDSVTVFDVKTCIFLEINTLQLSQGGENGCKREISMRFQVNVMGA